MLFSLHLGLFLKIFKEHWFHTILLYAQTWTLCSCIKYDSTINKYLLHLETVSLEHHWPLSPLSIDPDLHAFWTLLSDLTLCIYLEVCFFFNWFLLLAFCIQVNLSIVTRRVNIPNISSAFHCLVPYMPLSFQIFWEKNSCDTASDLLLFFF